MKLHKFINKTTLNSQFYLSTYLLSYGLMLVVSLNSNSVLRKRITFDVIKRIVSISARINLTKGINPLNFEQNCIFQVEIKLI